MQFSGPAAVLGDGATHVARQAAALFALSGFSAFLGMPTEPDKTGVLALIGTCDLVVAVIAWVLPWNRWRLETTALLSLPGFAVLAVSTWAFGGFAAGTGPFFVLLFVWLGLHQRKWIVAVAVVPATIAYVVPLLIVHASDKVLSSAMVLVPVAYGIGALLAAQVKHLREERDRAERAEQWRSALTATLAHDVRTPLTTVQATLQMLSEMKDLPEEDKENLLDAALRQTARLSRLSAGLLDVERVEHGVLRLDRREVAVAAAIETAAAQLAPGSTIEVNAEPDLTAYADPERLEQILVNLIANAARHGRPPIIITGRAERDSVHIEVRDHGDGVPAGRVGRLFERLGGDASHPDSVGLGMWIVRLLAEAHGGTVSYEPAEPGARFVVTLPADVAQGTRSDEHTVPVHDPN